MALSRVEKLIKMVECTTRVKPKVSQRKFFRQEIDSMIKDQEYLKLTMEEVEELKKAQFKG